MKNFAEIAGIVIATIIIIAIGFVGYLLAGKEFAAPFGGVLGFLFGLVVSIWDTYKAPRCLHKYKFTAIVGGRYGPSFRHDSRWLFTLVMAIMCGLAAFIWQLMFILFL